MGPSKFINKFLKYILYYAGDFPPPILGDFTLEDNVYLGLDIHWRRFRANIYFGLVKNIIVVNTI